MKKIIKFLFVIVIYVFSLSLNAQNCSWRSYIDIPVSIYSNGVFVNLNGNYAIREVEEKFDINGSIEYGYAGFALGLKILSEKTFCLDLAYQINKQRGFLPSFSIGVENITTEKYVSPLKEESSFDYSYTPRPPEVASAYLVGTTEVGGGFEFSLGLGRGRFVGYGPRSKYINFDVFSEEKHEKFVVGLFGGVRYKTPFGLSLIAEVNGRDANAGLQFERKLFKGTLSLNKIEHFLVEEENSNNSPRLNLTLSFNPGGQGEVLGPRIGILKITLKDESSGSLIGGKVVVSKGGEEKTFNVSASQKATLELEPGVYTVSVFSPGYKTKTAQVPVKSGKELNFEISLSKVVSPAVEKSMNLTKEASLDYKNGKLKEAKEKLEQAIVLYPNNEKAKEGLSLVNKAIADKIASLEVSAKSLENSGNIRDAIALWEEILSLKGEEESYQIRAHINSLRSRLEKKATPVTSPSKPSTPPPPPKATAPSGPSLSKQEIADLYAKGLSAYFDGNYKEAIKYFEQVLRADPNHAQAKRYLAEAKKH
ncbi:MAG: tetratricopeptide repeat protein [candidate division WOR-3 bacterium]